MTESFSIAERIAYGSFTPSCGDPMNIAYKHGLVFKEFLAAAAQGVAASVAGQSMKPDRVANRAAEIAHSLMYEYVSHIESEFVRYSHDDKLSDYMGYGNRR